MMYMKSLVWKVDMMNSTVSTKKPILLQIPIPLCKKHQHKGIPFGVNTCNNWQYIAIPTPLGSLMCRECNNELFLPQPYLHSADLSSANLHSANLHSANLCSTDLSFTDLSSADLSFANLCSADLSSANLHSANLCSADLSFTDLSSADLSSTDLSSANLRFADLSFTDLSSTDLSFAYNIDESFNLDKSHWNKFTLIDKQFKKLLNKDMFVK